MAVNYNDERFTQVEADKQAALTELENTYGGMIEESDKYYQAQIDATKQWQATQTQLQNERTDFAIEQIEQQKDQTTKDYKKEQSGAYVDWQKESNRYGVNAEQMAASGLANSGYSESSQVSMYNTYQNRVATARESYNTAILNYNNAIKDARLQNNAALAEIAYNSLQQQLELSLQGFQYKNQLIDTLASKKTDLDNTYYNRYQDVLAQINTENALAEEIRQYNQNYALQQQQYNEEVRQYNQNYALQQAQFEESKRQYNQNYALEQAQLAEEKRQFNAAQAAKNSSSGSSSIKKSSSSSGSKKKSSSSSGSQPASIDAERDRQETPSITTYSGAAAYLKQKGATNGDGGLMTESEWKRRKASGSKSAETSYSTYQQYLANFVTWRVANPDN